MFADDSGRDQSGDPLAGSSAAAGDDGLIAVGVA